jgi:peptidyl-prolyl cis-trans isomerase D
MFDFVRTHSRLVLGIMVLLIFPSFIFFGIQGYSRFTDGTNLTVAKVDGHAITAGEWEQAHQRDVERIRRQQPNLDAKLLETPELKRESLDGLVRERVLLAAANQMNLVPDDIRLQRLFRSDPQFAAMRNPDGTVNRELLAAQGMSSELFAQQLRQEFGMQQVLLAVGQSSFATPAIAGRTLDALLQRREVEIQRFDAADYRAKVSPSDADIESFYKSNEALFKAPEQASIEYVTLTLDALGKGIPVPEEDLRKYYEENAARFTVAEERRASHILIKADKDAPAADRKAAKAKAEELLAQLRKNPGSFAELARKNSQDAGSAPQGGDLDFFGRGAMVKPFEDAVFAMKVGEISNVVETDFGYHIITLTAVRGGDKKPFEAVRTSIEEDVRRALAQKKYAEVAEQFANTVYEQPDSLQPVIDKLKLVKQTATVQRKPAADASGALASTKLLDAVFSNEVVHDKRNTDAVEIGPNQMAAARILQYTAAHTLPLSEVKDRVRESVIAAQAAALARQEGAKRLAELQKAPDTALAGKAIVSRAQLQGLPRKVVDAVLRADASKLPVALGVDLGDQGYMLVRLVQVLPREATPGGDAPLRQQYGQAWAKAEAAAYLEALKHRFKVELKEAAVASVAASAPGP